MTGGGGGEGVGVLLLLLLCVGAVMAKMRWE